MAFDGYPVAANKTNATLAVDDHPAHHNALGVAVNELQGQLDTLTGTTLPGTYASVYEEHLTTNLDTSDAAGSVLSGSFAPTTSEVVLQASVSALNTTQFTTFTITIDGIDYGLGTVQDKGRRAARTIKLSGLTPGAEVEWEITFSSPSLGNLLCRVVSNPDEFCSVVVDRATPFP